LRAGPARRKAAQKASGARKRQGTRERKAQEDGGADLQSDNIKREYLAHVSLLSVVDLRHRDRDTEKENKIRNKLEKENIFSHLYILQANAITEWNHLSGEGVSEKKGERQERIELMELTCRLGARLICTQKLFSCSSSSSTASLALWPQLLGKQELL